MEMEPLNDPETHDDATESLKPEESEDDAPCVSAFNMIQKSLLKISVFASGLVNFQETLHSFTGDESRHPEDTLRLSFSNHPMLSDPLEPNGEFDMFVIILEACPSWNPHFKVYEVAKKTCNRCKLDMEYPVQCSYGLIINATLVRQTKFAFKDFTFENIITIMRMNLKMPCDKEGCGKRNYVQHVIEKLPTVFTIAIEWENNETEEEKCDTASVLSTEIDISSIYKYEGDSKFTKYRLVSMVCSHGDQYNCVAYENTKWVRHFGSQEEVIGDWKSVLSTFRKLNIRPKILYFENVMQRD